MTTAPQLQTTPMARHRFHLLDALRGLAALVVVVWHVPAFLKPNLFPDCGLLAVDFFFCLSGFVVAFAYETRLQQKLSFAGFTAARLVRLYPMYLLGTAIGIAIDAFQYPYGMAASFPHRRSALLIAGNILMVPNLGIWPTKLLYPFNDPAWSLFYELGANILYGALVRLRLASTWLLPVVAAFPLALLWRAADTGTSLGQIGWTNAPSLACLGWARMALPFSLGIGALRLYRILPHPSLPVVVQAALALAVLGALLFLLFAPLPVAAMWPKQIICSTLCFPVLVYLGANVTLRGGLATVAAFLGDISYPVYLLHQPFLRLLAGPAFYALCAAHPLLRKTAVPAFFLFLMLLSVASVKLYEAPVRRRLANGYAAWKAPRRLLPQAST